MRSSSAVITHRMSSATHQSVALNTHNCSVLDGHRHETLSVDELHVKTTDSHDMDFSA